MSKKKKKEDTKTDDTAVEEPKAEETKPEEGGEDIPTPNFSSFVFSISTTVLMDLGEIEHPIDKEKKVNLRMAKHSIDVLDMLKDKTEGNLTDQESALIANILSDLKLRYFKKTS